MSGIITTAVRFAIRAEADQYWDVGLETSDLTHAHWANRHHTADGRDASIMRLAERSPELRRFWQCCPVDVAEGERLLAADAANTPSLQEQAA